jgi:hypothetical protein
MEEDLRLRRHLHSPTFPSDPEPFPELTRSGSYSDSSATTVDNTSRVTAPFQVTSHSLHVTHVRFFNFIFRFLLGFDFLFVENRAWSCSVFACLDEIASVNIRLDFRSFDCVCVFLLWYLINLETVLCMAFKLPWLEFMFCKSCN